MLALCRRCFFRSVGAVGVWCSTVHSTNMICRNVQFALHWWLYILAEKLLLVGCDFVVKKLRWFSDWSFNDGCCFVVYDLLEFVSCIDSLHKGSRISTSLVKIRTRWQARGKLSENSNIMMDQVTVPTLLTVDPSFCGVVLCFCQKDPCG